jgi:chitin-binding protein
VTHQVDSGDKTGRQKILAVRSVAHTPDAFCARIDVNVGW